MVSLKQVVKSYMDSYGPSVHDVMSYLSKRQGKTDECKLE